MKKEVVISRLAGGLGNQMFQYACGFAVAQKSSAQLLLDKSFLTRKPHNATYTLRDFELDVFLIDAEFAPKELVEEFNPETRSLFAKISNKLFGNRTGYFKEKNKLFCPDILNLEPPVYLEGYWQNEKYFNPYRTALLKAFQPKQSPSPRNQELALEIYNNHAVCVHVRRGDYVNNASAQLLHGTCSPRYYENASKYLEQKGIPLTYYIFSDDMEWVKQNIHFPGVTRYINHNTGKESHWDLYLMKHGQHHIIANSSFSWWGAWLCERPGQQVVAPSSWFQGIEKYEITPATWILL